MNLRWSIANWPGLRYRWLSEFVVKWGGRKETALYDGADGYLLHKPWLVSNCLPEPLSAEARALVQAARGAR